MHILLLGNGFDLYYKLPTKYHNFLNTVEFLLNKYNPDMKTIGDVFGNDDLQKKDEFIKESYQQYEDVYTQTVLDSSKTEELICLMQDNVWFKYLLKSFNKDVGWIDFEKEISLVIESFQEFFKVAKIEFYVTLVDINDVNTVYIIRYIINSFDYFFEIVVDNGHRWDGKEYVWPNKVKEEYVIEYPLGSKNYIINQDEIIKVLSKKLDDLAKGLQIYLSCFVESITPNLKVVKCNAFRNITDVVTLNYTNTYEKMYSDKSVYHLHGIADDKIVLGINSDKYDELENMDTSFIAFKKYFQRTMYETDYEYLEWIKSVHEEEIDYTITVMGHSLDVTDEDIIKALFEKASSITVLYHDEAAKKNYITNLINIYGKTGFDRLRSKQNLSFVSLDNDFGNDLEQILAKLSNAELEELINL